MRSGIIWFWRTKILITRTWRIAFLRWTTTVLLMNTRWLSNVNLFLIYLCCPFILYFFNIYFSHSWSVRRCLTQNTTAVNRILRDTTLLVWLLISHELIWKVCGLRSMSLHLIRINLFNFWLFTFRRLKLILKFVQKLLMLRVSLRNLLIWTGYRILFKCLS